MLQFYRAKYSLIRDGRTIVAKYGWHEMLCDEAPQSFRIALTWADIEEANLNMVAPNIKQRRRGKVLVYDDWDTYFCIKQWREPTLDLEYVVTYQKVDMSIRDILEYYDSSKALRYLIERGIKYIGGYNGIR